MRDRIVKRDQYARAGVREYWLGEGDTKSVEVQTLVQGAYVLHGIFGPGDAVTSPLVPGLRLPVESIIE